MIPVVDVLGVSHADQVPIAFFLAFERKLCQLYVVSLPYLHIISALPDFRVITTCRSRDGCDYSREDRVCWTLRASTLTGLASCAGQSLWAYIGGVIPAAVDK